MSSDAPEPPHIDAAGPPPVFVPDPPPPAEPQKKKPQGIWGAILAALAMFWKVILGLGKVVVPFFKLLKGGKLLLTAGSMLVSVWFYALLFGWKFALGFVICIFVHEMGHVFFVWRQGVPVTAPLFIPGMGALIIQKQSAKSAWGEAVIGIGGPAFGTMAGFACWGLYAITDYRLFLALAFTAFFMNLFNMMPIFPLDGGWIVGSIHPYLWIAGLVGMVVLAVAGILTNPFIWILIILSLPYVWTSLKRKSLGPEGVAPATADQKWIMGGCYLGLAAVLAWAMSATHLPPPSPHPVRPGGISVAFIPVSPNLS
jgi:Zn-dependent protease